MVNFASASLNDAAAGIGPYTSNAVASIAGNQRVAVVDANVIRVLARLRTLSDDQKTKPMVLLNAQLADSLVDPNRPGCFNQVFLSIPSKQHRTTHTYSKVPGHCLPASPVRSVKNRQLQWHWIAEFDD